MKEISQDIEYKGKKYKLVFNLNVAEEIQEEYGSIEKWGELVEAQKNIKALKYGFMQMVNEGIDIANEEKGTNDEPFTLKQIGRMISELGAETAKTALSNTVVNSIKSNENDEKNA
jgi:hypothetical protein